MERLTLPGVAREGDLVHFVSSRRPTADAATIFLRFRGCGFGRYFGINLMSTSSTRGSFPGPVT